MSTLPHGAEALLIALQTPAPNGYMGLPVLLWGKPGEGKSSFLEALARPNFPVLTLIASIHDPTDFSGLPVFRNDMLHFAAPEWVHKFSTPAAGILFLDELTTAPPAVQSALLRVVLERKVGFHALPPNVRIVAAANPPDLMMGGWELSPPLRNRFVHLQWSLDSAQYIEALENGFSAPKWPQVPLDVHQSLAMEWKLRVAAFLKQAPDMLSTSPDQTGHAFASPRAWDFAIALMASCDYLGLSPLQGHVRTDVFYALLKGCVGEGTALAFVEFIQNMRLPNPDALLDGQITFHVESCNDGELYILFGALQKALARRYESPDLPVATLRFCALTQDVFDNQRRDVVYASLRKAAKSGLFTKTLARAQNNPTLRQSVTDVLGQLFSDEGLKEFIEIFEQ